MALTTIDAEPWITKAEVRRALRADDHNNAHEEDQFFEQCAREACSWFEIECGFDSSHPRDFIVGNRTIYLDGNYTYELPLPYAPIASLTSVSVSGEALTVGTLAEFSAGSVECAATRHGLVSTVRFTSGRMNVAAVYRSGFEMSALPPALRRAAAHLAALLYNSRGMKIGLDSESSDVGTTSYSIEKFPAWYVQILNTYREQVAHSCSA